jgi:hypothetical protein
MKQITFVVPVFIFLFIAGCKPGYYPCDAPPQVKVDTVKGVFEGETVYLKSAATSGASYKWSGPNGYTSTEQNPVITNVTLDQQGRYMVIAEKDGCVNSASFELKIFSKPPCTPVTNTIVIGINTYTLTNIRMTVASNGTATVTANFDGSSSGYFTVSTISPNKTNRYLIEQYTQDQSKVNLIFYEFFYGGQWRGADGYADVRISNGKPEITICNSTFVNSNFTPKKLSGKIVVP